MAAIKCVAHLRTTRRGSCQLGELELVSATCQSVLITLEVLFRNSFTGRERLAGYISSRLSSVARRTSTNELARTDHTDGAGTSSHYRQAVPAA